MLKAWDNIVLWQRVMIGLALGAVAGLLLGERTIYIKPVGDAFIALIRMLIVPLIFTTLVSGVTAMGDVKKLGSIGLKAIALYLFTTFFAVSIGLILGTIFQPGAGVDFSGVAPQALSAEAPTVAERLIGIIPTNPVAALASGDVLSIIFFAILFGVGIIAMGEKGRPIGTAIESAAEVVLKITHWVMSLAPFGVFALIAFMVGNQGLETFKALALLAAAVYLGCIIHMAVVYGGIVKFGLGLPLVRFFRGIFDAQAVAYSTSSSSATLPVTLSCVRENLGVPNHIGSSVIPLGSTINMDGTALYLGILALFASQAFGFQMDAGHYILVALTATLASVGAAGIPSASLFLLATVLTGIGATPEQTALMVGLILPFDRPLDMMRTVTNITGDAAVATTVSKWEGQLDEETFRKVAVT